MQEVPRVSEQELRLSFGDDAVLLVGLCLRGRGAEARIL